MVSASHHDQGHGSKGTPNSAKAIIWKPNEHAEEYLVFVDDENEYKKWKDGDKSIAMALFVGQFSIFKSGTSGHTGNLGEISKQEVENVFFGDEKNVKDKSVEAAIQLILEHGKLHEGDLSHSLHISKNMARGAGDTRATGAARGSHR